MVSSGEQRQRHRVNTTHTHCATQHIVHTSSPASGTIHRVRGMTGPRPSAPHLVCVVSIICGVHCVVCVFCFVSETPTTRTQYTYILIPIPFTNTAMRAQTTYATRFSTRSSTCTVCSYYFPRSLYPSFMHILYSL